MYSLLLAQGNEKQLDLLFAVAMDILPGQASAVSCEHVFSACKEADTLRRRRSSPQLTEYLQFLKHSFLRELGRRLDFLIHGASVVRKDLTEFVVELGCSEAGAPVTQPPALQNLLGEIEEDGEFADNGCDTFGFTFPFSAVPKAMVAHLQSLHHCNSHMYCIPDVISLYIYFSRMSKHDTLAS